MCSVSAPTVRPAAKDGTPTSALGSSVSSGKATSTQATRARGFTLIDLMVVMALIAVAVGMVTLSLRDPAANQLDREAVRLAALLEAGRAESRSAGVPLRFELPTQPG